MVLAPWPPDAGVGTVSQAHGEHVLRVLGQLDVGVCTHTTGRPG